MPVETQSSESPILPVTFFDLRELSEYAMEIDRLMRSVELESHRLLQRSGGAPSQAEAALAVLSSNEWRHAIWTLIGALIERHVVEGRSMSQMTDGLSRTAPEEDMRWHELSDVPETSSP